MNEIFREPIEHNWLQDVIHMFTLHVCPKAILKTYQHCHKINKWTSKEISNSHIVTFVIWKNIVNLSIPRRGDINNEENNALEKQNASLPIINVLLCHFEN